MKNYFNFALQSIKHRKLRSWLTILGIVIGIGAIVALISVSQGLENAISEQFKNLGSNKVYIFPKAAGTFITVGEKKITSEDVDLLEGLTEAAYVNSYIFDKVDVEFANDDKFTSFTGYETKQEPEELFEGQGIKLQDGRWFNKGEKGVTVIGASLAEDGFKKEVVVNNKLEVKGKKFEVIGIMEPLGNEEDDNNVWVDMEEARDVLEVPEDITFIEVVVKEGVDVPTFADKIERRLGRARDEDDLEVTIPEQLLGQLSNILDIVQVVLGGIAAISLLVGGVGIMNAMFTNVLERKKEIGILKSIGATPKDIQYIFITEAAIIGLVGGVLGSTFGVLVSIGIGEAAKAAGFILLKIQVEVPIIIFGIIFALVVGILAGYIPARDAAKLLPVEALRD